MPRKTHGMTRTKEYVAYRDARHRCKNPKHRSYDRYGGRGIEFRYTSFEQFLEDVGMAPSQDHSIDRVDNDGHYEPGNVRWTTAEVQRNNQSPRAVISYLGMDLSLPEWSKMLGVHSETLRYRLKCGWPTEEILYGKYQPPD